MILSPHIDRSSGEDKDISFVCIKKRSPSESRSSSMGSPKDRIEWPATGSHPGKPTSSPSFNLADEAEQFAQAIYAGLNIPPHLLSMEARLRMMGLPSLEELFEDEWDGPIYEK